MMRHAILYITTYISGRAVKHWQELSTLLACLIYSTVVVVSMVYILLNHPWMVLILRYTYIYILYLYQLGYSDLCTTLARVQLEGDGTETLIHVSRYYPLDDNFFWVVTAQQPTRRNHNLIRHASEFCINLIAKVEPLVNGGPPKRAQDFCRQNQGSEN